MMMRNWSDARTITIIIFMTISAVRDIIMKMATRDHTIIIGTNGDGTRAIAIAFFMIISTTIGYVIVKMMANSGTILIGADPDGTGIVTKAVFMEVSAVDPAIMKVTAGD